MALCSVACGIGVVTAIAVGVFLFEQEELERAVTDQINSKTDPAEIAFRRVEAATHRLGFADARFVAASQTHVPEYEECVVIEVSGTHYAFPLVLLSNIKTHVVNCQLDSLNLAVTYCDLRDSARVLQRTDSTQPLSAAATRFDRDRKQMILRIDGEKYPQMSPDIPLADLPFQRVKCERNQRFPNVVARKFFPLEHQHLSTMLSQNSCRCAACRTAADDQDVVFAGCRHDA